MTDAQAQLRQQTRAALAEAGLSQAEASRRLGVSTKHLSHMLTGRAPLTLDWAERLLALCDHRLLVAAVAETPSPPGPRQSLDDLTSDQLDALYDERDRLKQRVEDWKQAASAGMTNTDSLRAERDALAAGVPLVCTDERHKVKVFALSAEVARLTAGQCTHATP
jgi:transcriptional regulator with XRE-family HTH domain